MMSILEEQKERTSGCHEQFMCNSKYLFDILWCSEGIDLDESNVDDSMVMHQKPSVEYSCVLHEM